jgi:hypothetical protein
MAVTLSTDRYELLKKNRLGPEKDRAWNGGIQDLRQEAYTLLAYNSIA